MERSVDLLWEEVRGLIGNAEQSLLYGNPQAAEVTLLLTE